MRPVRLCRCGDRWLAWYADAPRWRAEGETAEEAGRNLARLWEGVRR
jgi:hypothetical protein